MSMKKLLACLLALMMALALVLIAWCGLRFRRPWRMTPIPEQAPALRWRP